MIDADWSVELGGGAPVIDALWSGFVDLRSEPQRITELAETAGFAPLSELLLALNAPTSAWWTSKCDLWQEESLRAAWVDLLPRHGLVFTEFSDAENAARRLSAALDGLTDADGSIEIVVRQAVAGEAEGYAITLYLSAEAEALSALMQQLSLAVARTAPSAPAE